MKAQYAQLADRGVVALGGPDAAEYLQNLVSNDVTRVTPERTLYACLLTPQGKFLFDFFMAHDPARADGFLLDVEGARLGDLLKRLTMYRLRAKVEIEDASESCSVAVAFGEGAVTALGLAAEGSSCSFGGGVAYVDPRLAALGVRTMTPGDGSVALAEAGLQASGPEAYERFRLGHGVPDGSRDIVIEKSFPLECNFDEFHAIDYDKGCYVGQELTARTHHRGTIRKRLMRVDVEGPLPEPGTPLMLGDKNAGEMRSGLDDRGLALIRLEHLAGPGVVMTAAGARLRPVLPDWLEIPNSPAEG